MRVRMYVPARNTTLHYSAKHKAILSVLPSQAPSGTLQAHISAAKASRHSSGAARTVGPGADLLAAQEEYMVLQESVHSARQLLASMKATCQAFQQCTAHHLDGPGGQGKWQFPISCSWPKFACWVSAPRKSGSTATLKLSQDAGWSAFLQGARGLSKA